MERKNGWVRFVELGVWCLVFGVWCLVFGVWCLVFGVWCLGQLIEPLELI
jgi:hypothetical protein